MYVPESEIQITTFLILNCTALKQKLVKDWCFEFLKQCSKSKITDNWETSGKTENVQRGDVVVFILNCYISQELITKYGVFGDFYYKPVVLFHICRINFDNNYWFPGPV